MRAIYPFARDHSDMHKTWQELHLWDSSKRSDALETAPNKFSWNWCLVKLYSEIIGDMEMVRSNII
ncbi:hypothetical protein DKX38_026104 [Salix brachista]|uniref:Uncharacterized protein n=1 Tax=Salix brachista TaxID=2182728 RepID=A0A5N5JWN6_9ROSI|nr:hypothetical protein DKX38_026104 [Salix brachista]